MEVDPRDANQDAYRAYLINHNSVFIVAPGQSSSFRWDSASVVQNEGATSCPRIQEVMAVARNAILRDGKRLNKHILLKFPGYMELSNTIYSPKSQNGKIKATIIPYGRKSQLVKDGPMFNILLCRIAWKVHIVDAVQVVEEAAATISDVDDMNKRLAGTTFFE